MPMHRNLNNIVISSAISKTRIVMLSLFRYLCIVLIIIAYDKHDNRTIPSDLR